MTNKGKPDLKDLGLWCCPDKKNASALDPNELLEQGHYNEAVKLFYEDGDEAGIRKVMQAASDAGDLVDVRFCEQMLRKLTGARERLLSDEEEDAVAEKAASLGKESIKAFLNKQRFLQQEADGESPEAEGQAAKG